MVNGFKGWLKIYLFYGVIFFLLGLFGYLATDEVRLATWSYGQIQRIKQVWPAIMFQPSENLAVPAFTSQFGSILLWVYRTNDDNHQFDNLLHQLQSKLQSNFERISTLPVDNLNGLDLNHSNPGIPWILVGYHQSRYPRPRAEVLRNSLYFGIPEQASYLLAGKMIQVISAKLPTFTLSKQILGRNYIFELNWDTSGDSQNLNTEVFSAFIKILTTDALPMIANKTLD